MIDIIYKKYWLKINAIWFCCDKSTAINQSRADIVYFHGTNNDNFKNSIINLQHTLITDLEDDSENIFKKMNKNYQYEINRSIKEKVECISFDTKDLRNNSSTIENFKQEYAEFTKLKDILNSYNECAMKIYIENDNLILTKAFHDKEVFAQHLYVCDGINARLLYSVSNFRSDGINRSLIGRANKYLHWHDIEFLKANKYKNLDWGGISSVTDPNGIDIFKKGFGGQEKTYYNEIHGKSVLGKLVVFALKMKRG